MQKKGRKFTDSELRFFLTTKDKTAIDQLHHEARKITADIYEKKIYIRGLIEFSNYCKEGCYYCGINRENSNIKRFRLSKDEIYLAGQEGYKSGFRTFVLQGGEDLYFSDDDFVEIIRSLKKKHSDCAVTLSIGVRSEMAYRKFKKAGCDRFLLRFETSNLKVFKNLHPKDQSLKRRLEAIKCLKKLGYQTGTGFMVGAPQSSIEDHIEDVKLIRNIRPEMIGIGPFIPHKDTRFKGLPAGQLDLSLRLISILRIENPSALIPSTTALNTIDEKGRILGILAGANVLMPNLSPNYAKKNYSLYDNKQKGGLESKSGLKELKTLLGNYGYEIEVSRGDFKYE